MEIFEYNITKVRHYKADSLGDICWLYENATLSYRQAVQEVKVQCALNIGLAERKLYLELTKRGKRLPMMITRRIQEAIIKTDRELSVREEVESIFREAKHLRSK